MAYRLPANWGKSPDSIYSIFTPFGAVEEAGENISQAGLEYWCVLGEKETERLEDGRN